jgi:hypothetical protein
MNQCKQCGATLPADSRYCLQCGTENTPSSGTTIPQGELDFLKPAITGGLALGVLSSIPIVNYVNACCCLWAQAGGALTAWLLDRQRPGGLRYSDGALGGVLSGLIGAFVATIISIPVQLLLLTPEAVEAAKARFDQAQLPPEFVEMVMRFMQPGFDLSRTLISLLLNMLTLGLFAMVGGIIAAAILGRKRTD